MSATLQHLSEWLQLAESERLEFKEARTSFDTGKLVRYCAALANEGGGHLILGVSDRHPRAVLGTTAFRDIEGIKAQLVDRLRLRVGVTELLHPDGRVLVFEIPARPLGMPVGVDGAFLMRAGESLVAMTPDQLRRIFSETGPDFSAEACPGAALADLDGAAVSELRKRWHRRSKNDAILGWSEEELLYNAELLVGSEVTFAALILLGTHRALGRHLPASELVFEYRSEETPGPANQREEFREGFLHFYERLWELVNLRNDRQHYQEGLFMLDIPTFNEEAVREAVLNAVAHRDYRHAGSVFVRQFPRRIEIVSPGGFPQGISVENILDRQLPRNRRVADVLSKCGLVERAGQGANRIFESCIREGKPLPDFSQTDSFQVALTLHGQVRDTGFVRFLERVSQERQTTFDTHELLLLDLVHRDQGIPPDLRPRMSRLVELGVLERVGRGAGARYLLSRRLYRALGKSGAYTRRKGLDDGQNKALLLRHLESVGANGSPISELQEVVPALSRAQVHRLLGALRDEGLVSLAGQKRGARWFAERGKAE